jgi:cell division transport system ATP-binding protein
MTRREKIRKRRQQFIEENGIIFLDNVSKSYSTGAPALNGVTLQIKPGEFVFIVGDSGSGKSTLIKLLLRELVATQGGVYVIGQDLKRLRHRKIPKFRRHLGVVFQDFRLLNDRNVYENVAFAQRIVETRPRDIQRNVPAILATVGLAGKYKAKTKQLSGGEQQRVALARALVNSPAILLADEPTGNLDPKNSWDIMQLLDEINRNGTTVVVVTHNRDIVNGMRKRVVAMKKGIIISDTEEGEYTDED